VLADAGCAEETLGDPRSLAAPAAAKPRRNRRAAGGRTRPWPSASTVNGHLSTIRYIDGMEAAGSLVRAARQHAGLSQAELGRRAGVTQSVISAYESGARQPSMPTLTRIIEATGAALDIRLQYPADVQRPEGLLARRVQDRRNEILAALRRRGLTNPRLFGSVARGKETPGSDVDLLVDVPAGVGLFALARCQSELEALLGVPVDLVPAADLKPGVATQVLAEAVAL
jgi:predicted nucleotidyltransferase/ribosome-binding protein aMBF1 (putative translation factor)